MGKQPIALRPLIGMDAAHRRALRLKVAEVSRWLDQQRIPDEAFLTMLVAARETQHSERE